jgi:hypothetical protein
VAVVSHPELLEETERALVLGDDVCGLCMPGGVSVSSDLGRVTVMKSGSDNVTIDFEETSSCETINTINVTVPRDRSSK